ncbi:MAG: MBL fold metallo-hydrolase, partial [Deltaproteobacteria bacterium]|nr:MBL fold metallo-hydrolase [Deltaproteobacteria bacterium]
FLDVGQGDAALLRFPNGKNWMIDAGGLRGSSFDVGEKIIAPALWRSGVYSLDRLVISHPHVDHFSGAMSLVELFSPRAFVSSGVAPSEEDDVLWRELLKLLLQKHIKQEMIAVPYPSWQEGEISIRLLHPPEYDVRFLDPNEGSLVLSIQYQDVRALFMGDGGLLAEAMLKKSIDRHDILKVGHHGSRTSTGWEFLAEVDPRIAIVSVGAQNRYGLPDEEVLKRLSRHGVEVYRTDQDGAVTITTDGNRIKSKLSSPSVLIGDLM